jgi:hypothetical protein
MSFLVYSKRLASSSWPLHHGLFLLASESRPLHYGLHIMAPSSLPLHHGLLIIAPLSWPPHHVLLSMAPSSCPQHQEPHCQKVLKQRHLQLGFSITSTIFPSIFSYVVLGLVLLKMGWLALDL